jgi:HEAT repeat protein
MSDRRLDLPLVTGIAAGGQAVILLDGLDQIPATRHRRLRFIQWFIKELADPAVATCPVVISGRPWAFDRHILCHPRVQQFGLMDLASKDVRRYIAEYPFADAARRNRALRSFARVPRASLLLDRPLLLDGFCFACDRSPAASVRTETQIVEQTVHELLEQRGIGRIPALEALAHLAWQCWNSPGHQLDAASAASAVASGPRVSEKVVRSARTTLSRSLIQHLSRHSGILLDHSGHYCFAHDVYLEYFVGRWLASANPNTIKRIFGMHAWAPAWDGVITFMMSHLWRQDRQVAACLVRWLLAEAQAGHDDIWKTLALLAGRAMVGLGGDRDAKENALVQEVIESVLEAWSCRVRYCTGHNGRLAAMRTLLGLADFDQQAVLRGLVAALATDDLAVAATEVLGLLDCEASELELRRIARSATSAVLRTAAVKVLGTLDSSAALDTVIGALHDSDVTVRCQAARSLGDNGSSVAIQALVAAVRSAPCDTRGEVIDVLGHLDAPSAVPAILAVLSGEVSAADQQRVVVRALGRLRVGDAVGIMEKLATESGDSLFCTEVVDALAQIGTDEAIAALARLAKQDRGCARGDALEILSCVAPTSTTLCILKDALADGDPHLRATAVSALGILALPEAADVLVRVFRDDRDELVRARAASALGLCRCVDAVDLLMQAVGGDKLMLAWTASIAIVRILGSATAVRAFVDALARGGSVARGIPAILGFLGSAAAGDALPERDRLTPGEKTSLRLEIFQNAVAAIIAAVSNTSPDIRAAACSSLGQLGAYQGIKVLLLALGDTTAARVRQSAADALGKLGAVQAAKELIRTLRDDSDAETRARAGSALGELRCVEAESSLITALKDNNSRVRCAAADALGLIRSKSAARQLQPLLAHTDPSCRRAAVRALGRIGLISQRVIRMLRNDPDGGVRWAAARALGEVQCTDGISALTQALVDVDDLVAKDAAVALGQIRAEESVPYLIGALRDTRPDRRGWAAQALGMIGTSSAVHGLLEIIDDDQMVPYFQESRTVGQLAAEALLRINDPETLPRLVGDLGHPEPRRQRKAFAGLLLFQPPEFAKAVLPALNRCSRQAGILLEHYCQRHSVTVSASGRAVGPELLTLNASLCPILPASPLK